MNDEDKKDIKIALAEYNAKYTPDNPPEFSDYVVRKIELGDTTPDEAVLFTLVHFYAYYKELDLDIQEFIEVVEVMGEAAEEQEEDEADAQ